MLALAGNTRKAGQVCHELIVIETVPGPLDLGKKQAWGRRGQGFSAFRL